MQSTPNLTTPTELDLSTWINLSLSHLLPTLPHRWYLPSYFGLLWHQPCLRCCMWVWSRRTCLSVKKSLTLHFYDVLKPQTQQSCEPKQKWALYSCRVWLFPCQLVAGTPTTCYLPEPQLAIQCQTIMYSISLFSEVNKAGPVNIQNNCFLFPGHIPILSLFLYFF